MTITRHTNPVARSGVLWTGTAIWLYALTDAVAITDTAHPAPALAMLDSVVVVALVAIAALVIFVKRTKKEKREHLLDAAWHDVLDDPHYMERRHLEERKHVVEKQQELASLND
jgi:hypothetical protein